MQAAEITNIVTYLLLAAFALWFALDLLSAVRRIRERALGYWVAAFCAVSGSALLGGLWQEFAPVMDPQSAALVWTFSMTLSIAGSFLFLVAVLQVFTSGRVFALLAGCAVMKFALFAVWASVNDDLRLVFYDNGFTMLVMLIACSWGAWSQRVPSASWILAGVVTAMVAALFQQGRVSIHRYFNHDDLYRVIQMGALYCLYRAGPLLRDKDLTVPDFEATQPLPVVGEE